MKTENSDNPGPVEMFYGRSNYKDNLGIERDVISLRYM